MKNRLTMLAFGLLICLTGCGFVGDTNPPDLPLGAFDMPLTGSYGTYSFRFLGKYRITHQWITSSENCKHSGVETLPNENGYLNPNQVYAVIDIYEEGGKVWQKREGKHPADFTHFVRSVKTTYPIYPTPTPAEIAASTKAMWEGINRRRRTGRYDPLPPNTKTPIGYREEEEGWKGVCYENWMSRFIGLSVYLHQRDLAAWKEVLAEKNPNGRWSERRVGNNLWYANETAKEDLDQNPIALGGPYQFWVLPIGDSGYSFALKFSANAKTLKNPEAFAKFEAAFRHLIESVKIEPISPTIAK